MADGRVESPLFAEEEQTGAEDSTLVPSIADVTATESVVAHLADSALPLVSLTSRLDATGEIQELVWTINSSGANMCEWRVPAKRLFTGAPTKCWMGGTFRWDEFGFVPSTFLTGWRNSSDLNVTFYKTKNSDNSYTAAEVNGWGVWDFRIRLGLSLSDTVDRATVLILAMPVTEVGQRQLPGFEGSGDTYPHICVHNVVAAMGPLHGRTTGQPLRVFIHHVQEQVPDWDPRELWTAVREMMADPLHCTCPELEEWHLGVRGPGAPEMPEHRQSHSWPPCPEIQAAGGGAEDDGVYSYYSTSVDVGLYIVCTLLEVV